MVLGSVPGQWDCCGVGECARSVGLLWFWGVWQVSGTVAVLVEFESRVVGVDCVKGLVRVMRVMRLLMFSSERCRSVQT